MQKIENMLPDIFIIIRDKFKIFNFDPFDDRNIIDLRLVIDDQKT